MKSREEIGEAVVKVLHDNFPETDFGELTEDSIINRDAGIDSMGFVLVICKLEAQFDVRIPEDEWPKLMTMGDVITAIQSRLPEE